MKCIIRWDELMNENFLLLESAVALVKQTSETNLNGDVLYLM